jgi:predicted aspartyl protease
MPLKLWRIYFLKINSMVEGKFQSDKDSSPTPVVPALIGWNGGVQTPFFILDTGFSGELSVTEQMGKDTKRVYKSLTFQYQKKFMIKL